MIGAITGFLSTYRIAAYVGLFGLLLASGTYVLGDTKGYARADKKCVVDQKQSVEKGLQKRAVITKEVMSWSDDELDAYLSNWLRD